MQREVGEAEVGRSLWQAAGWRQEFVRSLWQQGYCPSRNKQKDMW